MRRFLLLSVLPVLVVNATNYEDNSTNVGVYVNQISACNLNHDTGNMLCLNREFESVVQYHDVRDTVFCPYHYCVLFKADRTKVACTGYVYLKVSGSMDQYMNPLTPVKSNVGFTGNPKDDYVKIRSSFLNYNVLVDRFEQSVESYSYDIQKVTCMDPYSTCLEYTDGTDSLCFGAKDVVFHNALESALLGLIVPGLIAFSFYSISGGLYRSCLTNPCFTVITIPMSVTICSILILFVASDFIVKVFPFLFSSIFGIVFGFLSCRTMYGALGLCKQRLTGQTDSSYGAGETRAGETIEMIQSNSSFAIEDDDDDDNKETTTEIDLGTVGKKSK